MKGHHKDSKEKDKDLLGKPDSGGQKEVVMSKKEYEELMRQAHQRDEQVDKYLRLYADYENSKKLWEKQKQELLKFGNSRILKEFVSIIDEIEAALSNLKDQHPEFEQGLAMIYKKIKEVLQKEGLKPIEAEGKIFDPHIHEALLFEERKDLPDHSIIEVIQKGYCYEDKVLRPAGVKVSLHKSTENGVQSTEKEEAGAQGHKDTKTQVEQKQEEKQAHEEQREEVDKEKE